MFSSSFGRRGLLQALRQYSRYSKNDQIFLHDSPRGIIASLSKNPNALPIGVSPTQHINPDTFQPNGDFLKLLNTTIHDSIEKDFTFIIEAGANANSFMPIYDLREIPNYGRTPEVDNVFGYVLVDGNGKITPKSFDSNNLYRVCNGAGLIKLSDYLHEQMKSLTEAHQD